MSTTKKLLIIEDNDTVRKLIRLTFSTSSLFDLQEAASGEEGLRVIRGWHPDIVLLDLMLPEGISGIDLCREVKNDPLLSNTYIAVLSSLKQEQDILATKSAGADEHLFKPFSPIDLFTRIEKVAVSLNR